jgi:hypothetical protein
MGNIFINDWNRYWDGVKSLFGIRDIAYVLLVVILVFVGREVEFGIINPLTKSRRRRPWSEPIRTPEGDRQALLVLLVMVIGAGMLVLVFQKACPSPLS